MKTCRKRTFPYYLKWIFWIVLVQFILVNISAAFYAFKFTHFYNGPIPYTTNRNVIVKTWKLFTGPSYYKDTEEVLPSFPYREVAFESNNHININAWYSSMDSSRGCVILFHGISINKGYLIAEATVFRRLGYNVLLVDFRGHGKSGGNDCTFGVKETDEVQKAFAFARQNGNNKIILYGVSMGAVVCIKAASENKVQPAAIIADMPFGTLKNHLKLRAKAQGFPQEPFATLVTFWMGIERGYNGFTHDATEYAKNISCPVLLECGERDRYVLVKDVGNIFAHLKTAHKKLVVYSNADHESYLQLDPNKWERETESFLQSVN
jgi:hypothetical protein